MRSVIVHGVLAALGLAAAWWVWNDGDRVKRADTAVTLFACDDAKLSSVVFKTATKTVALDVKRDGDEPSAWITVTDEPAPPAKGATPTEPKVDAFTANEKLLRVVEKVAPFTAERTLGDVAKDKLGDLGLDKPKESVTITCGGEKRTYALGSKTYGGRTRYIQSADGGAVHLIGNSLVGDLEMAEFRFMQRDLVRLNLTDVDEVAVKARPGAINLVHRNRRERSKAMWVSAAAPDQRNELYGNWLSKVMRLRALDYLEKGKGPGAVGGKSTIPVDVVSLQFKGDKVGRIDLVKTGSTASDASYFARTTATRGWVTVPKSLAGQIESDIPSLLGQEQPESPDPKGTAAAPKSATAATK